MPLVLCWRIKSEATNTEISLPMLALHMHSQRGLRLKNGVTGSTSVIYSVHMQMFVKQQGSHHRVTLVTNITFFTFSVNSDMLSHSCMSCQGVITKFAIHSRRLMYNWVMWVQICNCMVGLLAFFTEVQPCIKVIFMQMLHQGKSRSHYVLTDRTNTLLRSAMINQNCVLWLRSLHQILCFHLSPWSSIGRGTWRFTQFHCWMTPLGWHGCGLRGCLRNHIVFQNCLSFKCAYYSGSIRGQSNCHEGKVNALPGCTPNFVLLNHIDRSLWEGQNKPNSRPSHGPFKCWM